MEAEAPELFSGKYQLITEFGRSLLLKAGVTFSRIGYIKNWIPDARPILMTHVGSNQVEYKNVLCAVKQILVRDTS